MLSAVERTQALSVTICLIVFTTIVFTRILFARIVFIRIVLRKWKVRSCTSQSRIRTENLKFPFVQRILYFLRNLCFLTNSMNFLFYSLYNIVIQLNFNCNIWNTKRGNFLGLEVTTSNRLSLPFSESLSIIIRG